MEAGMGVGWAGGIEGVWGGGGRLIGERRGLSDLKMPGIWGFVGWQLGWVNLRDGYGKERRKEGVFEVRDRREGIRQGGS